MTDTKTECQNMAQSYINLDKSERVIFKAILDMTVVLLKSMQTTERRNKNGT